MEHTLYQLMLEIEPDSLKLAWFWKVSLVQLPPCANAFFRTMYSLNSLTAMTTLVFQGPGGHSSFDDNSRCLPSLESNTKHPAPTHLRFWYVWMNTPSWFMFACWTSVLIVHCSCVTMLWFIMTFSYYGIYLHWTQMQIKGNKWLREKPKGRRRGGCGAGRGRLAPGPLRNRSMRHWVQSQRAKAGFRPQRSLQGLLRKSSICVQS